MANLPSTTINDTTPLQSLFNVRLNQGTLYPLLHAINSSMLRSALSTGIRTHGHILARRTTPNHKQLVSLASSRRMIGCRFLSSEPHKEEPKKEKAEDAGEAHEIMLTPGEQVVAASRLTLWAGIGVFAIACAYYIGKELIPTKMSPNVVFNKALEKVRENDEVSRRLGTPIKGYGRDHGGKRVGRRNFIEHTEYKSEEDGSGRTRVRFNLEGPQGQAFVFAEVSNQMPSGEFVYLLVQDKASGRVTNVVDNRAALAVGRMTAGNSEGSDAMNKLLTGGK